MCYCSVSCVTVVCCVLLQCVVCYYSVLCVTAVLPYSSPHLMEVRERIRIDGRPLSRDKFTTHFNHCYGVLDSKKVSRLQLVVCSHFFIWQGLMDGELPGYFRFLTIMAYHTFLEENVQVFVYL